MSCVGGDIVSVALSGRPHREYGRVLGVEYVSDHKTLVVVKVAYEAWGQVKTTVMWVDARRCRALKRLRVIPDKVRTALEMARGIADDAKQLLVVVDGDSRAKEGLAP